MIEVKEVGINEALEVHKNILEFKDTIPIAEYFENRYKNKEKLIIVAYNNNTPIGYIIGYDKYNDGSFYCWMAGVDNNYRKLGALTGLMNYQIEWAKNKGYNKIKIKTRNTRREMLGFLVKNGFNFASIESKENIEENRINLEKII